MLSALLSIDMVVIWKNDHQDHMLPWTLGPTRGLPAKLTATSGIAVTGHLSDQLSSRHGLKFVCMEGKKTASTADYGMHFDVANSKVIALAKTVGEEKWKTLPITMLPARTRINACVERIDLSVVDEVTSGDIPIRDNYEPKLWMDSRGELYIVDGHTRAAIYYEMNKPMPVRIMDEQSLAQLGD